MGDEVGMDLNPSMQKHKFPRRRCAWQHHQVEPPKPAHAVADAQVTTLQAIVTARHAVSLWYCC